MKTILLTIVWIGFWFAVDHFCAGIQNGTLHDRLGAIAGFGAGFIIVGSLMLRLRTR
jgi:hypothetical protein